MVCKIGQGRDPDLKGHSSGTYYEIGVEQSLCLRSVCCSSLSMLMLVMHRQYCLFSVIFALLLSAVDAKAWKPSSEASFLDSGMEN